MSDNLQATVVDSSEELQDWPVMSSTLQIATQDTQEVNNSSLDINEVPDAAESQNRIKIQHYPKTLEEEKSAQDTNFPAAIEESPPKYR